MAVREVIDTSQLIEAATIEWDAPNFWGSLVPLAYWSGRQRMLVPDVARSRVDRLVDYERLYRGDFGPLSMNPQERLVSGSEFARVADTYALLLMAYPPAFTGLADDFDTDGLLTAINEAILDLIRYGTALLYSYPPVERGPGGDGGGVVRLDPRWWFPAGKEAGAYVNRSVAVGVDGQITPALNVSIQLIAGRDESRVFGYSSDGYSYAPLVPETLDDMMEMPSTELRHDGYPVQVCALPPLVDGWGVSMYEGMVRLVAELSRRMSSASTILGRHAAPHLQAVRDDRAGNYVPNMTESGQITLEIVSATLDEVSKQAAFIPPDGVSRMEYLTWDGRLEPSFKQREAMLDELAAVTRLPSALYGVLRGGGVPTGASLRRQYAMTHSTIEAIQTMMIPRILRAIKLAAGGDEVTIDWLNPIDELDTVAVAPMAEADDKFTDIRTGQALSEDVQEGEFADGEPPPEGPPEGA